MNGPLATPRLLLVTNRKSAKMPLPELARLAIRGGVDIVQLREKDLGEEDLRALAIQVLDELEDPDRFMINNSQSIATELGIGLHMPEANADSPEFAQRTVTRLSRSVHAGTCINDEKRFDFVIAGHVFETRDKGGRFPLGLYGLRRMVNLADTPVVGIGGITPERCGAVLATGAAGIAVMSAINNSQDPESAANDFVTSIQNGSVMEAEGIVSIQVNGKPAEIAADTTVMEFLKGRGHHERLVVVELNGQILKKALFEATELVPGDRVEIVHFVGGG